MNPRWPPTCSWRESRSKTRIRALVYLCSSLLVVGFLFAQGEENLRKRREDMVQTQIAAPRGRGADGVQDSSVLDSMRKTPRHRFVPAELVPYAYNDRPVPIGYGQTISQPYIVAKMTELLEPKREHQVLEIGSGSGYQTSEADNESGYRNSDCPNMGTSCRVSHGRDFITTLMKVSASVGRAN